LKRASRQTKDKTMAT